MTRSVLLVICLAAGPALATGELPPSGVHGEPAVTSESVPVVEMSEEQGTVPEAAPVVETSEVRGEVDEPAPSGEVARAGFTTQVVGREPLDSIERLSADQPRIFFFTELQGLAGQTVTHRWEHGGEVMAEVPFEVGGDRWRVFSSKQLLPGWVGEWSVAVLDSQGRVLATRSFEYVASPPASQADTTP